MKHLKYKNQNENAPKVYGLKVIFCPINFLWALIEKYNDVKVFIKKRKKRNTLM